MADKIDIDELVRHELYLQRLSSGIVNSTVTSGLEETYKAIRAILSDKGIPVTPKQLTKLEAAIAKAIRDNNSWSMVTSELEDLAVYEAGVTSSVVEEFVPVAAVADSVIINYVNESFMVLEAGKKTQTGLWAQFTQANTDSQTRQILDIIRTGYAREESLFQVGKNIREAFQGVLKTEADALARTGFNHYSNMARDAWASSNADLDLYAHAVFTFDNRISDTCKFLSTQKTVWKVGDPRKPSFPAHFRCRSFYTYLPKGVELSGTRASVGGQSGKAAKESFEARKSRTDKKVKYRGKRDAETFKPGQVRAATEYENWLDRQPAWFIDDTLGVTKGKLFRGGDLELKSFYDLTGKPLTLDQIKSRHPKIWTKVVG